MRVVLSNSEAFFKNARPYTWNGSLYESVTEFEQYLATVKDDVKRWAAGVTIHHTYRPTVAQWMQNSGAANLRGLVRTWRDTNGWSTGPNMVIAPEGIYLASGILAPGIHATICNHDHIGIEIVGDYNESYWREPILSFVFGAVGALADTIGLSNDDIIVNKRVNGHRECLSPKTCPGSAIDLNRFRQELVARRKHDLGYYEVLYNGTLTRTCWSRDCPQVQRQVKGERFLIDEIKIGQEIQGENRWAHRADRLGFIHFGALKKV